MISIIFIFLKFKKKKDYLIIHEEIIGILENDSYYEPSKSRSNWFYSCRSIRLSATETDAAAESKIRHEDGTERY